MKASNFAFGAVLSQYGENKCLYLVTFHFQKFCAIEINYKIHDKELLAIVDSFQEWQYFLERAQRLVTGYTSHKNLKYFIFARVLNRRQVCWIISFLCFNFVITYRLGSHQIRSNALLIQAYLAPKERDAAYDQQQSIILKPKKLLHQIVRTTIFVDAAFFQDICISLQFDPLALRLKDHSKILVLRHDQSIESQFLNSEVIDLESSDHYIPCPQIQGSPGDEMPRDDTDPRFLFPDGLLYY